MIENLKETVAVIGDSLLKEKKNNNFKFWLEKDHLKCSLDLYANEHYFSNLKKIKDVPIVSEENIESQNRSRPDIYWLIDPIDGTRSLVDGFKGWVTQAALIKKKKIIISVIYAPEFNEMFWAEKNNSAYLNKDKLFITKDDTSKITLIDNYAKPKGIAKKIYYEYPCDAYKESGSISLKICRIADNTANLFVKDVPVRDWDIAAPMLIIEEAGGNLRQLNGLVYNFDGNFEKKGIIASSNFLIQKKCFNLLSIKDEPKKE